MALQELIFGDLDQALKTIMDDWGTYHNGTLKDNSTYINGWLSTDGGDNVRGFVNW